MNALFEKVLRSWQLFKSAVAVIRSQPKLLLFPLVTTLATLAIAVFFLAPPLVLLVMPHSSGAELGGGLERALGVFGFHVSKTSGLTVTPDAIAYALWLVVYLASMYLATFCNVAFFHEILAALNGDRVSLRRGFRAAAERAQSILWWTLLAGAVGALIRALEERLSFVGRFIVGLIGLAWSVASVFVIPVLVADPATRNPFKVLSKSAGSLKRTWGEMLVGFVGLQGMNAVVLWITLFWWVLGGGVALLMRNGWVLLPVGALWLLAIIAYSYVAGVATKVYLGALYLYATEGVVPEQFDPAMMDMAWKVKSN